MRFACGFSKKSIAGVIRIVNERRAEETIERYFQKIHKDAAAPLPFSPAWIGGCYALFADQGRFYLIRRNAAQIRRFYRGCSGNDAYAPLCS